MKSEKKKYSRGATSTTNSPTARSGGDGGGGSSARGEGGGSSVIGGVSAIRSDSNNPVVDESGGGGRDRAMCRWVFPYFVGLFVAYSIGLVGLHFSWFLVLLLVGVSQLNRRRVLRKRAISREFRNNVIVVKEHKVTESESCYWFNGYLHYLWPHINPTFSATIELALRGVVDAKLLETKVIGLESIIVKSVNLGKTPFIVKRVKFSHTQDGFTLDTDVRYEGEAEIILELILGGKLLNVNCPLFVNSWVIDGRMKFDFTFASRFPFMYKLDMSFYEEPKTLDLCVHVQSKFDVMSLSFIKEEIETLIRSAFRNFIVLPYKYSYYFTPWPTPDQPNPYPATDPDLIDPWDPKVLRTFPSRYGKPCHTSQLMTRNLLETLYLEDEEFAAKFHQIFTKYLNEEKDEFPFTFGQKSLTFNNNNNNNNNTINNNNSNNKSEQQTKVLTRRHNVETNEIIDSFSFLG